VRVDRGLLIPKDVVVPLSWARVVSAEQIELLVPYDDLLGLPEYRSDDEIRADILRRVFEDPRFEGLDRYTLKAEVVAGVVRLSGRVRSAEIKLAVQELAASTRGVLSVKNELLADDEIAANVEHALRSAGLPLNDLAVSVLLGQVKLRGIPPSPEVRDKAMQNARSVAGVHSVEIV
jgi:osmotically-inducible protein OsmY